MSSILLSFDPIARALDSVKVQLAYPCEDISSYYSGIDGLSGAALMKELGSLVSDHKSLPYKEVGDCVLLVLSAIKEFCLDLSRIMLVYDLFQWRMHFI